MEVVLLPEAEKHLDFWKKSGNQMVRKRITALIKAIVDSPFDGIGKPEALKHQLAGK